MIVDLGGWARFFTRRLRERAGRSAEFGYVLGETERGRPVHWPRMIAERAGHVLVMAASGSGKTAMIASALVNEFAGPTSQESAPALLAIDAKGDLVAHILQGVAAIAPERLADVTVLDPFGRAGFPFNLVKLGLDGVPVDIKASQIAGLVAEVSTNVGAQRHLGVGARQLDVLTNVILGAMSSQDPRANLLWALDALVLPRGLRMLASVATAPRAKQFLESADLNPELQSSCSSRLRTCFAASEMLERLVAAPSCIDFAELLAPGKMLIADIGRPTGGHTGLQDFYAGLITALAFDHLMARPSPFTGHACRIACDEAQVIASSLEARADAVLTLGRSRKLALTVITQGCTLIQQAAPTLLPVLMNNAPVKVIGRLPAPDAEQLAKLQAPKPGIVESLSTVRSRFVATTTNLPDRMFLYLAPGVRERFISADVDLAAWKRAAAVHQREIEATQSRLALGQVARVPLNDVAVLDPPKPRRRANRPGSKSTGNNAADGTPPRPRSKWG